MSSADGISNEIFAKLKSFMMLEKSGGPSADLLHLQHTDSKRRGAATDREDRVGKVSTRRVFGYLQIGTHPSAFAVGMLRDIKKNTLGHSMRMPPRPPIT